VGITLLSHFSSKEGMHVGAGGKEDRKEVLSISIICQEGKGKKKKVLIVLFKTLRDRAWREEEKRKKNGTIVLITTFRLCVHLRKGKKTPLPKKKKSPPLLQKKKKYQKRKKSVVPALGLLSQGGKRENPQLQVTA